MVLDRREKVETKLVHAVLRVQPLFVPLVLFPLPWRRGGLQKWRDVGGNDENDPVKVNAGFVDVG